MNIAATRPDLTRFLELKDQASRRISGADATSSGRTTAPAQAATGTESFLDIIRSLRPKAVPETAPVFETAPATRKAPVSPVSGSFTVSETRGLLGAYGINRALSGAAESPAQAAILSKKHLGNLFDGVA